MERRDLETVRYIKAGVKRAWETMGMRVHLPASRTAPDGADS